MQKLELVAAVVEEVHSKASYRNFPSHLDYVIVVLEMIVKMHSSLLSLYSIIFKIREIIRLAQCASTVFIYLKVKSEN